MNNENLNDKEKIEAILEAFQLNIAEFSRKIDVKLDTIYSIFYEKTKGFSMEILKKIIKTYPEISPFWLITGEGDMIINNTGIIQHHNGTATATQMNFADRIGKSHQHVSALCSGKTKAGRSTLELLLHAFPTVRPEWLYVGTL